MRIPLIRSAIVVAASAGVVAACSSSGGAGGLVGGDVPSSPERGTHDASASGIEGSPHTPATGCRPGFRACGDVCADVASDRRHCGACGTFCMSGPCESGGCADGGSTSCVMKCGGACKSSTDIDHCGSCFNVCSDVQLCSKSACVGALGNGSSCASPLVVPREGEYMFRFDPSLASPHLFPCGPLGEIPTRWFRYTAEKSDPQSELRIAKGGADYAVEIFSGSCGNLTSLGCAAGAPGKDTAFEFAGEGGKTYFIAVGRAATTTATNPILVVND